MMDYMNESEKMDCRAIVFRMSKDFYGNGKPGAMEDVREIKAAIIGDINHDGMATDMRILKDKFKRLEERPRNKMLKVKDVFYIILAIFGMLSFLAPLFSTFLEGLK